VKSVVNEMICLGEIACDERIDRFWDASLRKALLPGKKEDVFVIIQQASRVLALSFYYSHSLSFTCMQQDPFYEFKQEMPIRSELFIQSVDALIERVDKSISRNR
jgi:hypothetical protein